jgi:hypothetical protein
MRKIPKCECGNDLVFGEERKYTAYFKFGKDNFLRKRPFRNSPSVICDCGHLYCSKCGKTYDYEYDPDKDMIDKIQ